MTRHTALWCAAAMLHMTLALCSVQAQEPPEIITDRPDFTESPTVVPLGSVQAETGATGEWDEESYSIAGPEALLRWSPVSRFELRLTLPDYIHTDSASGFGDATIGAKVELGTLARWHVGSIASVTLPTGDDEVNGDGLEPEVLLTAGRDVSESWSLGAQVSAALKSDEDIELAATLVAGTELTERIETFIEAAVSGPAGEPGGLILHHGYTLRFGRLMQADLHAGIGLTDAAPQFLLGAGWSARF